MDLQTVKLIHITCVVLSISGFILRGLWLFSGSSLVRRKAARILPHVVDTLLLVSAIWLAVGLSINPLQQPWLMAKIIALVVYIALGVVALKPGITRSRRLLAWLLAIAVFGYIVAVATSHQVWPLA